MKILSCVFLFLLLFTHAYAKENIRFGVFAYKGVEDTKKQYQNLVNYLNEKLDNRVTLEVLTQEDMNEKIKNRQLDIVTTNPTHFLHIRQQYALSGAIATLRGFNKGVVTSKLAGVIFVKKDSPIQMLKDLKNKTIATPSTKHMGGFRAQAYELYLANINIITQSKDIKEIKSSHQNVVHTIINGDADVGFIRDGILEQMLAKNEIQKDDIRIINEQNNINHPYRISTRLYPEWPVFSLSHVDEEDVKIFAAALFSLEPTEVIKNAGIYDYTLPADYLETEELSRALRLPPFDKAGNVTIIDILQQYKAEFIATLIFLILGLFYHIREKRGKDLLSSLLSNMGEGVYGIDKDGTCTWINKKALDMLGYSEKEILHKNKYLLCNHHKLPQKEHNTNKCLIHLTSKDKVTRNLDEFFIKKDGSLLPVNLTVTPTNDSGAIVVFRDISDLIEKQKKLEKSENLFRTLFEIFPEPIIMTDLKTQLPYKFNKAAHLQLGYSANEFEKIPISKYDALQNQQEIQKHIETIYKNGSDSFETKHCAKDGSLLDIAVSVQLIYLEEKPYLLSVHRNITQINRYQRDLTFQKQRLDSIIEGTNIGTWEWDIQIGNVIFNERWAEIIGYTLDELSPISIDTWIKYAHPGDLLESKKMLEKHFSGELDYYECESRMKHKNGHWVWVLDRGKVSQWNKDGKPVLMSGTHQDITAIKLEQEELASLNNQLGSLLQSIPDLVWMKDADGVYITCNRRFEDFFGASKDEIHGKTDYDFVSKELADFFREHDKNAMHSEAPVTNFEEILFAVDGHKEFIQTTKTAVKDKNGTILGVLGIGRDLSELKKNEEALKEAKEEADRANLAKSDFLANMSHEIRTPMNAILGLSELMLDANLSTKQKDYLQKIHGSSKMLLGIINDILDYSKIEANKMEIEHREFNLGNVLSQLKMIFAQSAINKGLKLFFELKGTAPRMVVGDELRINQVLVNLLSNALKFTNEGHVTLSITVKEQYEHSALINFSVSDTGIGIACEDISKLFAPFSQADNSTTRKYGGTGLGLSISTRLVEAMGGRLNADSQKGVGSTFSFEIELGINSWDENKLETVDELNMINVSSVQDFPDLSNIKILLVEDNEINQEVALAILKKVKIEAVVANNGKEAVTMFLSRPNYFNIILMDLQMPIMNGYEATTVIREHNKDIPIIALTAAAMVEDREKVLKVGMNDHLPKPINSNEMLKTVAKWCNVSISIAEKEEKNILEQNSAILDIEYALNIVNSNKELLHKILSKFLMELENEFASLPALLSQNDPSAAPLIHALKGVSGNIGAKALSSICNLIYNNYKKSSIISKECCF
jgi:PAS domain S-box-containing protein